MAKSAAHMPKWVRTLDAMIADNLLIKVHCDRCPAFREMDLVALRERTSGNYSLLNRRCRCRTTLNQAIKSNIALRPRHHHLRTQNVTLLHKCKFFARGVLVT
jgi:hypothetical protein